MNRIFHNNRPARVSEQIQYCYAFRSERILQPVWRFLIHSVSWNSTVQFGHPLPILWSGPCIGKAMQDLAFSSTETGLCSPYHTNCVQRVLKSLLRHNCRAVILNLFSTRSSSFPLYSVNPTHNHLSLRRNIVQVVSNLIFVSSIFPDNFSTSAIIGTWWWLEYLVEL